MTSLAHIHVIKGKPGKSAEIQRSLVLAAGHEIRDVEVTDTRVVLEGRRRGEEGWTRVVFTADQAKKAGIALGGYPEDKLYARATTRLCRRRFPDVVSGIAATIEELEDGDFAGPTDTPHPAPAPQPTSAPKRTAKRRTAPKTTPRTNDTPPQETSADEAEPASAEPAAPPPSLPGDDTPADATPPPSESDREPPVTRAQLDKIHAQLGELDVTDRPDKLAVAALLVQRPLDTSNDLTKHEATHAIDTLARVLDSDDPKRTLDAVLGELED